MKDLAWPQYSAEHCEEEVGGIFLTRDEQGAAGRSIGVCRDVNRFMEVAKGRADRRRVLTNWPGALGSL